MYNCYYHYYYYYYRHIVGVVIGELDDRIDVFVGRFVRVVVVFVPLRCRQDEEDGEGDESDSVVGVVYHSLPLCISIL